MGFTERVVATVTGSLIGSKISRKYLTDKVEKYDDHILGENQFPNTTILLPTLNEEWFIENTLKSIKNQNIYKLYPNRFEILVVDSYSTDNTLDIAKNYVDKILIMEERNLVKARTIGIANARGDMIVFVDADTIYPINWLNSMLKVYRNDPSVVAVSGPEFHPEIHFLVDIYEPIAISLLAPLTGSNSPIRTSNPMIGHNSSCYKWAFNLVGGFDVPFKYEIKSSKDTQMVLERYFSEKLKSIGKYIFDPQLIVYDYGGKRRFLYINKKQYCNTDKQLEKNKYICQYWNEIDKKIRF